MAFHKDLTGADLHEPKAHKTTHQNGGADKIQLDDLEVIDIAKGIILPDIDGSGARARLKALKLANGSWQIILEEI